MKGWLKRRAKRHGHWSGPSGKVAKFSTARSLGWDGEGFERSDGTQAYALLMNSNGRELYQSDGIHTLDAMRFLTDEAARSKGVYHVGFGISYDVNMMLGDVSRKKVRRIADGEFTALGGGRFVVKYIPAKSLWVKNKKTSTSMTLFDTFGFHQAGFVRAAERMLGAGERRLNVVREGKAHRGQFTTAEIAKVRRYCATELEILVEMTDKLLTSMRAVNLQLKRLDGAGAVATAMLTRERVRDHMAVMPDEIHLASTFAYAGGRVEMLRYGYDIDGGFGADARSAYPTVLRDLPCLKHGRWRRRIDGDFRHPFAVAEVRWDYQRYGYDEGWLNPFFVRNTDGGIYYPATGHNWVWRPELDAARKVRRFADPKHLEVIDGWEWVPACEHRPFAFIDRIYEHRRALRGVDDVAQLVLKLGMNSLYGKCAQHVGGTPEHPPPFHQLEWAGFVTSTVRARVFSAALRIGRAHAISIMTDGLLCDRDPSPYLDDRIGDALGEWELKRWSRLLSAQSGVYFYLDGGYLPSCPKCGRPTDETPLRGWRCMNPTCRATNYTAHNRGFNAEVLDPDDILAAWDRRETQVATRQRRFYTMKWCLRSDDQWTLWRTWGDEPRTLDAHATGKRFDVIPVEKWTRERNPQYGLMPTHPSEPFVVDSMPYSLAWEEPDGSEGFVGDKEQVSLA